MDQVYGHPPADNAFRPFSSDCRLPRLGLIPGWMACPFLILLVFSWAAPEVMGAAEESPVEATVESWITSEDGAWGRFFAVFLGTIALEDAAAIAVGLLYERGEINLVLGMLGLFAGIFLGDLGLYLLGRLIGVRVLQWRRIRRAIPSASVDRVRIWLNRRGWVAIFLSRMVPGTRWPLYVVAGAVRSKSPRFIIWTLLAALIWVPTIVLGTAVVGPIVVRPLEIIFGESWLSLVVAVILLLLILRGVLVVLFGGGRQRKMET